MPTERPILFSAPMVRAILAGMKSQTRRVVKPQPVFEGVESFGDSWKWQKSKDGFSGVTTEQLTGPAGLLYDDRAYCQPGDRLWVRETFGEIPDDGGTFVYRATDPEWRTECGVKWKPSIFMPRRASRLTLEVADVRVERLHEISEADAKAEGVSPLTFYAGWHALNRCDDPQHRKGFSHLWDGINASRGFGWDGNPFVWVVSFHLIEQPTPAAASPVG